MVHDPESGGPFSLVTSPSRAKIEAAIETFSDAWESAFDRPLWDQDLDNLATNKIDSSDLAFIEPLAYLNGNFLPLKAAQLDGLKRGAIVGIAAEKYYRKLGVYPDDVKLLSDRWIEKTDPIDPLTGELLKIKSDGAGFLVYSCGTDRDDDGGTGSELFLPGGTTLVREGDWIVWPRK